MTGIRVVTDSSSDLPADLIEQYQISIVPLDVRLGEWDATDMAGVSAAEFWHRCATTKALPETSSPSPGAFAACFTKAAADGCTAVVCLTLSAELSGTYEAACVGAREAGAGIDVRVVDTRSVSLGQGLIVLEVAEAAAATNDVDLAERAGREAVRRTRVFCVLDTMDNVRKGGRLGAAKALLGSLLAIKPVIEISDGVVRTESRPRTRAGSFEYLANIVKRSGKLRRLGVAHAAAPDVDKFLGMLAGSFPVDDILVSFLGPVIGAHGGPGCVGIALL